MLEMIGEGPTIYQDIIEEDDDELTQVWSKGCIHSSLEGRCSIAQTKRHYTKFVMAVVSAKSNFRDVTEIHMNLVIALEQIQLREATSSPQFIQKLIYGRNGKAVLDRMSI